LFLAAILYSACADPSDSKTSDGSIASIDATSDESTVPTDAATLFAFLQASDYRDYPAEPSVHPSSGPHGQVRSFFHPTLASSLEGDALEHPVGAAVVKELHSGGELSGWAVMVKTDTGVSADSWYYYEVLSTTDNSSPVANGNGVGLCAGCHASGTDYILSTFP
jgi:hypothetical protein